MLFVCVCVWGGGGGIGGHGGPPRKSQVAIAFLRTSRTDPLEKQWTPLLLRSVMTKTNKQTNKQTFQLSGPPLPLHDVIDPHMFTTPHAILRTLSSTSRLLIKILKINGEPGGGGGVNYYQTVWKVSPVKVTYYTLLCSG